MIKNIFIKFVIMSCVFVLFVGCGASEPDSTPDVSGPSGTEGTSVASGTEGTSDASESSGNGQYIGSEAAKRIALEHAGPNADEVRFAHADLEQDHENWKYDIEFYKDNIEYDYDIDALTGKILSFDQDEENARHGTAASAGDEQITEDSAKQIALKHAGVAEGDVQRLKVELDYDDGRAEYEVEWHVGQTEYSCDVDAVTGEVLSFKEEPA